MTNRVGSVADLERVLLRERTWRYLRYMHLREAFELTEGVRTVLCVGAGKAYAELALALEYPDVEFRITDIESERTPNYQVAEGIAKKLELPNISFGVLDIFQPPSGTWDLVTSIETLEHLEDDATAARNMLALSDRYVFALVPFAHKAANANPRLREKVWRNQEHFRVGYDEEELAALFPRTVEMRGCYFEEGQELRRDLMALENDQIDARAEELLQRARGDIRYEIPRALPEALGIWTLARAHA